MAPTHADVPEPAELEGTFFTERQAHVLALRAAGCSQASIARRWGTSRANVSALERTAREKLARARRTLQLADRLFPALSLRCEAGAALVDLPPRLYRAADRAGVKVRADAARVIQHIRERAPDAIERDRLGTPIDLAVTADGALWVRIAA